MTDISKLQNYQAKLDRSLLARDRVRSSEDDHHMEFVDEVNGIAYINDARSSRVTATRNSLEAIETSVVLILGGNDHENDYSLLSAQIRQKVVAIVYLGENSDHVLRHYSASNLLFAKAMHIREAVTMSGCYARSGDVVLFSPACSGALPSDSYKSRGNEFKSIVKELKG
jgi:UDP-N-acetylmuramoylalanine--D-glutamate ligase